MKRRMWWIALLLLVILMSWMGRAGWGIVSLNAKATGEVIYSYGSVSFSEPLTEEEAKTVSKILNGKVMYSGALYGIPSCGFTPKIAIKIDGVTFALACDACGTLRNCSNMMYLDISAKERAVLEEIFRSRGGTFPCI